MDETYEAPELRDKSTLFYLEVHKFHKGLEVDPDPSRLVNASLGGYVESQHTPSLHRLQSA